MDHASGVAVTSRRFGRPTVLRAMRWPPAFLIYIDQGEELYARAEERERRRFSEILFSGLGDSRVRAMISMRADFVGDLQKDKGPARRRQRCA
ncbi:MAG TPA: hypothetical protein VNZ53_41005 [Steroidobacteraceae bacterium]|nr:hypothetical protein [Steroidobacteraceae bacterium]